MHAPSECRLPYEVISQAQRMMGDFDFNLFHNNDENFAIWCKAKPNDSSGDVASHDKKNRPAISDKKHCHAM